MFKVYMCSGCVHILNDEFALIGYNAYAVYYVGNTCPHVEYTSDYVIANSKKIKLLLKDAIYNNDRIILLFFEEYYPALYYNAFEKLIDAGYDIQIITIT